MSTAPTSVVAAQPPNIDVAVVMELLGSMRSTYGTLNQSLNTLREQGNRVKDLGPTMKDAEDQIKGLREGIDQHDAHRADTVAQVKNTIRGELREEALKAMQARIKDQIKAEVQRQVKHQIEQQLVRDHLGTPLEDQVKAGREQVAAMEAAVANSRARRENAAITWSDMSTPFKEVVRADKSKSAVWPADLTSLLAYDDAKIVQLGADYELHDHRSRSMNINGFLSHIGVVAVRLY